nr:uracil-DNA glycosylase family protein [Nannocystis sp. SCPEA4]
MAYVSAASSPRRAGAPSSAPEERSPAPDSTWSSGQVTDRAAAGVRAPTWPEDQARSARESEPRARTQPGPAASGPPPQETKRGRAQPGPADWEPSQETTRGRAQPGPEDWEPSPQPDPGDWEPWPPQETTRGRAQPGSGDWESSQPETTRGRAQRESPPQETTRGRAQRGSADWESSPPQEAPRSRAATPPSAEPPRARTVNQQPAEPSPRPRTVSLPLADQGAPPRAAEGAPRPAGDASLRAQAQAWTPAQKLEYLRARNVGDCTRCKLSKTRTNIVFGVGDPNARVMFIGEAPGADEDRRGEPFVGAAGRRLTQWIERLGMKREQVYIANVLKCRPPGNREPAADEIEKCSPFLRAQIRAIRPAVIVALGRYAGMLLIGTEQDLKLAQMRNRRWTYDDPGAGLQIPLHVTYHPSYVIRREGELPPGQRNPADDTVMSDLERALRVLRS